MSKVQSQAWDTLVANLEAWAKDEITPEAMEVPFSRKQ